MNFIGGAIDSSLGGWSYAHGGWRFTSLIGIVMPLLALLYFLTEKRTWAKDIETLADGLGQ
ncbi:hypothetical protein [Paenibacillus durus]|uniref:hypothetical protein n=1 Tax=Paenibacillus durus TaxID=44251 RepID=UPI0009DE038C|nr:hypothetical protein [Paenibacillus durus]